MSAALHLVARIAGRTVAIASAGVDSVVDIGAIVPVPHATRGVVGLAALRSRVVAVVDPAVVLGCAATAGARRAIVLPVEGHFYALLVEAVEDVAPYDILPLPAGVMLDAGWSLAARGLIDRAGEPVLALDPAALIPVSAALAA